MIGASPSGKDEYPRGDDGLFGRAQFEAPFYHHAYVSPDAAETANERNHSLFVWPDPSTWGVAPRLRGRRVAIIANSPVFGHGPAIDAHDDVIRLNRMEYWQRSAADDGERITIWAGLPKPHIIFGVAATATTPRSEPLFPKIAPGLSTIWSATPFHLSVAYYNFLSRNGMLDRLLVSGSGPFLRKLLDRRLPPGMVRALFLVSPIHDSAGRFLDQPAFELLLTGIRVTLLCVLAGADEIGLFGFNFYEGTEKKPGTIHNIRFEKQFLGALTLVAPRLGSRIVKAEP